MPFVIVLDHVALRDCLDRHVLPVLPESCERDLTHHAAANNAHEFELFNASMRPWSKDTVSGDLAIRAISTGLGSTRRESASRLPERMRAFDCVLRLIPLRPTNSSP